MKKLIEKEPSKGSKLSILFFILSGLAMAAAIAKGVELDRQEADARFLKQYEKDE